MQAVEDLRRENEKMRVQRMEVEAMLQKARSDVQVSQTINGRLQQELTNHLDVLSEFAL